MRIPTALLFITLFFTLFCGKQETDQNEPTNELIAHANSSATNTSAKVTFVELGSVSCIPCKMMVPVMKAIEEEFGDQLHVVFHDVWKDKAPAQKYGIKLIPTQVFLDENGNEFFRHEGFFAKEEIEKLLTNRGLKILKQVELN